MNKIKQWFRSIIEDEARSVISTIETDVKHSLTAHAGDLFSTIDKKFTQVAAAEVAAFKHTLDDAVKSFEARISKTLETPGKEEPSTWQSDDVKSDHQLRHPRPARR